MVNMPVVYISQWDTNANETNDNCGPTSVAMILNWFKENYTPNQIFEKTGGSAGQLISITQLQSAITACGYKSSYEVGDTADRLKALLDQGIPVIALVHAGNLNSRQDQHFQGGHFIVVVGYRDDGYFVMDSDFWGQYRQDGDHHFYTNDEFLGAWGNCSLDGNPNNSLLIIYPNTAPIDYEKLYNEKRTECDINWNAFSSVCGKLGVQADPNDKNGSVQSAETAIQTLTDQLAQATQSANDSKQKYESELQTNINLNDNISVLGKTISDIKNEDKQYGQEALDAQHERDAIKSKYLNTLTLLGLTDTATGDQVKQKITSLSQKKIVQLQTPSIISWILKKLHL